jgi:hypothetical protein
MKYLIVLCVVFQVFAAKSQTANSKLDQSSIKKLEAGINSNGDIVLFGESAKGKLIMYSGKEAVEKLRSIAQMMCVGGPSSVSVSVGVVSVTWEKCILCKGILPECKDN